MGGDDRLRGAGLEAGKGVAPSRRPEAATGGRGRLGKARGERGVSANLRPDLEVQAFRILPCRGRASFSCDG